PEESLVGLQFDDPADAREHVRADDRGEGIDEIAALRFRPSSELAAKVREVSHVEPGDARHLQGVLPRPLDHRPVVVQSDVTSHREEAVPHLRLAFIEVADEHCGSTDNMWAARHQHSSPARSRPGVRGCGFDSTSNSEGVEGGTSGHPKVWLGRVSCYPW